MNSAADVHGAMTCADVSELAGLYVLGALEPAERERVAAHLASCPEAHAEVAELGGAVTALALAAGDVVAPAALRSRVLSDYRAAHEPAASAARPVSVPRPVPLRDITAALPFWQRPRLGWAAAAAAVLVIAVAGGYALTVQQRADQMTLRDRQLAAAVQILAQPDSMSAFLAGTGPAAGAHGFATFSESGEGYLVMVGLPQAPAGQTYQAWFIKDGNPTSAGLLNVGGDAYAVLPDLNGLAGTSAIALTIERAGGVDQPTSDPVAVGELHPNSAAS